MSGHRRNIRSVTVSFIKKTQSTTVSFIKITPSTTVSFIKITPSTTVSFIKKTPSTTVSISRNIQSETANVSTNTQSGTVNVSRNTQSGTANVSRNTQSGSISIGRTLDLSPTSENLFEFSNILNKKYGGKRVAPSATPKTARERQPTVSSALANNSLDVPFEPHFQPIIIDEKALIKEQSQEHHSNSNRKTNKKRKKPRRFVIFLIILICAAIALVLSASLIGTLYKPGQTTTTTTTTTTTITTITTTTTTTTDTTTTTACYFGEDYINLVDGGRRQISSLKVGDRVWSISNDGKQLIEDEIIIIPHFGPNTTTDFYTFTTIEGSTISLTDIHFIAVVTNNKNKIDFISASKVTLEHKLIMVGRTINLKNIIYSKRIGYYSPITMSGHLLVNNLSTSVYSAYLSGTHDLFHQMVGPFRIYYRITRWLFGNDFIPLGSTMEEEIHPISLFILNNYESIQLVFTIIPFTIPIVFILSIFYLNQRYFLHTRDYLRLKIKG